MTDDELKSWREEIASQSIREYGCGRCHVISISQAIGWQKLQLEGFEPDFATAAYVRKCESCKNRKPYAWVRDIPLPALREFMTSKRESAWPIDDLKALLPKRQGFEFL